MELQIPESGVSAALAIVVVKKHAGDVILFLNESRMSRTDVVAFGLHEKSATSCDEFLTGRIEIWSGDFFAAADADFVGAVHAPAAEAPVDEQIVKIIVLQQSRGFDGFVPSELMDFVV